MFYCNANVTRKLTVIRRQYIDLIIVVHTISTHPECVPPLKKDRTPVFPEVDSNGLSRVTSELPDFRLTNGL